MEHNTHMDRRQFLKSSRTAGGLVLGFSLIPGGHLMAEAHGGYEGGESLSPNLFVNIGNDGSVAVTCHRSEMGQQIRTSIAQIVADELEADWSKVEVVQATGDAKYGDQNTDGSRSIRRNLTRLRQAGAAARHMLTQAAANGWKVPVSECEAIQHTVTHKPTGRRIGYDKLVAVAAGLPVPAMDSVALKPREQWRYIATAVQSLDIDAVVKGEAVFGHDVQMSGMQVAMIVRPPVLFGKVKSLNTTKAEAVAGVTKVIVLPERTAPAAFNPLGGVAVVANSTWAAMQGRRMLEIEWDHGANAEYTSDTYNQAMLENSRQPGTVVRQQGDTDKALADAATVITAEYTVPHLSQAPMETPAATAVVADTKAEIWASTQTPQSTRGSVAAALGLPQEQVTVHVTMLGGGFGRKSKPDYSVEAALLAKEVGTPVKVIWSREDDIQQGYYHSVSAQHLQGAQDAQGNTTGWLHRTVFPSISSTFNPAAVQPSAGEMRLGFVDNPFEIQNMRLEKGTAKGHIRIGWLRSVSNVYHAFAVQSFAHELAVAAGQDPKDYLLKLIGKPRHVDLSDVDYDNYGDPIDTYPVDTGRLANVVKLVADKADWTGMRAKGRHLGIAAHRSFLTYVATIVEVDVDEGGRWSIPQVHVAIDAGTVVNLEHVKAQCEGGSIYGLSCALGQITAKDGAVEQSNFHNYQVARMSQAPTNIDVHIVESEHPPAGVGEPPTPPFAPALANALFEATGVRVRNLPIPTRLSKA